ncbi:MAG: hypothetical protein HY391_06150, partial [Deltaproteobacteria bacterium]|nr:hypothetical protein [Deltaproteobacteria bacterium]
AQSKPQPKHPRTEEVRLCVEENGGSWNQLPKGETFYPGDYPLTYAEHAMGCLLNH